MRFSLLFFPLLFEITAQTKRSHSTMDSSLPQKKSSTEQPQNSESIYLPLIQPSTSTESQAYYFPEDIQRTDSSDDFYQTSLQTLESITATEIITSECIQTDFSIVKIGDVVDEIEDKYYFSNDKLVNFSNTYEKRASFSIYSDFLTEILDFKFAIQIFVSGSSNANNSILLDEFQVFFPAFYRMIRNQRKRHFISGFSFSKNDTSNPDIGFNNSIFFLISFLSYSLGRGKTELFLPLKRLCQTIYHKCSYDVHLTRIITEMFDKLNQNLNLQFKSDLSYFVATHDISITLQLISLIYSEKYNQTNTILREYMGKIWDTIVQKKSDITSRMNLSKFYQLEFFNIICEITKKIEKGRINPKDTKSLTEEIEDLIYSLDQLVKDFKIIGYKFPCRILRSGNTQSFEKFIRSIQRVTCLDSKFEPLILCCICEFEVFFRLQCAIYLYDVETELHINIAAINKNKIYKESLSVFSKFSLINSITEIVKGFKSKNETSIENIPANSIFGQNSNGLFDRNNEIICNDRPEKLPVVIESEQSTANGLIDNLAPTEKDQIPSFSEVEQLAKDLLVKVEKISIDYKSKNEIFSIDLLSSGNTELEKLIKTVDTIISRLELVLEDDRNSEGDPSNITLNTPIGLGEMANNFLIKHKLSRKVKNINLGKSFQRNLSKINFSTVRENILNSHTLNEAFNNLIKFSEEIVTLYQSDKNKFNRISNYWFKKRLFLNEIDNFRESSNVTKIGFKKLIKKYIPALPLNFPFYEDSSCGTDICQEGNEEIGLLIDRYLEFIFSEFL